MIRKQKKTKNAQKYNYTHSADWICQAMKTYHVFCNQIKFIPKNVSQNPLYGI